LALQLSDFDRLKPKTKSKKFLIQLQEFQQIFESCHNLSWSHGHLKIFKKDCLQWIFLNQNLAVQLSEFGRLKPKTKSKNKKVLKVQIQHFE